MHSLNITPELNNLSVVMDFIKAELEAANCEKRQLNRSMLICEETIVSVINNANPDSEISLSVSKKFGKLILDITSCGAPFKPDSTLADIGMGTSDYEDSQVEYALRNLLLNHFSDSVKYSHKGGVSRVKVLLKRDEQFNLKLTFSAIAFGIALGFIFRFLIPEIGTFINTNISNTVTTIFINSMRTLVGPIVFFSILNSVIGFDDIKLLGRIGAKLMSIYVATSVIAALVGLSLSVIISPGELGSYVKTGALAVNVDSPSSGGFIDMIVGFFPQNFVASFLNNDTIQLIVIAVACGLALNSMGKRNEKIRELVSSLNEMIGIICTFMAKIIPVVIVCSISGLVLTADSATIVSLLAMCGTIIIGYFVMMIVYSVFIVIFARQNPFILFKKYVGTALMVFSLSSSNASIPINMEFSQKIGISKKIYSISVPLGATLNMDGGCVSFIIFSVFLAKIYGIALEPAMYIPVVVLTIFLSMGVPGVAGGTTAFIIPILLLLGVPAQMSLVILGVDAIMDMTRTALNTLGDQCATLIVASSEELLDKKKYYSH